MVNFETHKGHFLINFVILFQGPKRSDFVWSCFWCCGVLKTGCCGVVFWWLISEDMVLLWFEFLVVGANGVFGGINSKKI